MQASPSITLVRLGELARQSAGETALAALRSEGLSIQCSEGAWQPLSGGLETNECDAGVVRVDGIDAHVVVSMLRETAAGQWLSAIVARPVGDAAAWVDRVRDQLRLAYTLDRTEPNGTQLWARDGGLRALLVPVGQGSPQLLLNSATEIREAH